MKLKKLTALVLLLSLCLALAACGAEESPVSDAPAADDGLVDYTVEGVGTFRLPEGFEMETGSTTDPLPTNYVVFEKDGVTISCSRFGKDAYEAAGVPLPADVEEYSTRSGVQNAVPAGTEFAYDSYGSYAAQFTDEDGISWYYVLLKGTDAYASCYLYAPADASTPTAPRSGSAARSLNDAQPLQIKRRPGKVRGAVFMLLYVPAAAGPGRRASR